MCYAIVMGVGWVLAICEEPGEPLILAGAVVSTIPVLSLASYFCFAFTFFEACEDNSWIKFGRELHTLTITNSCLHLQRYRYATSIHVDIASIPGKPWE